MPQHVVGAGGGQPLQGGDVVVQSLITGPGGVVVSVVEIVSPGGQTAVVDRADDEVQLRWGGGQGAAVQVAAAELQAQPKGQAALKLRPDPLKLLYRRGPVIGLHRAAVEPHGVVVVGNAKLAEARADGGLGLLDVYKRQAVDGDGQVGGAAALVALGDQLDGVVAVSYPHLDVYKRQM